MKRVLCLLIIIAVLLPAFNGIAASDYERHWASSYINYLLKENIIKGDSNGKINPDINITRAEFATVINSAFKYTEVASENFCDVSENEWYYTQMKIALKAGYFKGDNAGNGNPLKPITREEAATALSRILNLDVSDEKTGFIDDSDIQLWARGPVKSLKNANIIKGYEDNSFRPQLNMKRGECFTIIAKEMINKNSSDIPQKGNSIVTEVVSPSYSGGGGGGGGGSSSSSSSISVPAKPYNLMCNAGNYTLTWQAQSEVLFKGTVTRTTEGKSGSFNFETTSNSYNILSEIQALMQYDRVQNESFLVSLKATNSYGESGAAEISVVYTNEIIKVPEITVSHIVDADGTEEIKLIWDADEKADTYTITLSNNDGETYSAPLSVIDNGNKKEASLSEEQINNISGKNKLKLNITSKYPELYLSTGDVVKDVELPLFSIGSTATKYNISNKRHFLNMKGVKDVTFNLTNDISLGNYIPFEFSGKLNGNNHSIEVALESSLDRVGLFTVCSGDSEIKNLSLKGSIKHIGTDGYTGGVFAEATAAFTLDNVKNYATIEGYNYVGGVVGYAYMGKITINSTTIKNYINYGNISGNTNVGGAGGLVSCTVKHCANVGNITGDSKVAGIIGWCYSDVDYCFNSGNVSARTGAGGIMAVAAGEISDAVGLYNSGNVSVGKGICNSETIARTYKNCYNANSSISAENALATDNATYDNCYTVSTGGTAFNGVSKITSDELKNLDELNFDKSIWKVDSSTLYEYPQLIEFPHKFNPVKLSKPFFEKPAYNDREYVNFYISGDAGAELVNITIKKSDGIVITPSEDLLLTNGKATLSVLSDKFTVGESYNVEFYLKGDGIKILNSETATKVYTHKNYQLPSPSFSKIEWAETNGTESYTVSWNAPTEVSGINDYEITLKDSTGATVFSDNINALSFAVTDINSSLFSGNRGSLEIKSIDINGVDAASLALEIPLDFKFAGTDSDYILIGNERHMKNIDASESYKVISDITLSGGWTGISGFSGEFNGNNKTITFSNTSVGLFSDITSSGKVMNVKTAGKIVNTIVSTGLGSIAGINRGTVTNCINSAILEGKLIGGIAGQCDGGSISYCSNTAAISGSGNKVGGIVGETKNNPSITYCSNTATVSSTGGYVGGIVGYLNKATITNSYNTAAVSGTKYIGGIAGATAQRIYITDCYNQGNITSTSTADVAGINSYSGSGLDTITNCYNTGAIKYNTTDYTTANGIFGANKVTTSSVSLNNCYYLSNTEATAKDYVTITGGGNLTEDEMKQQGSFTGFDFDGEDAMWIMGTGEYLYPILIIPGLE